MAILFVLSIPVKLRIKATGCCCGKFWGGIRIFVVSEIPELYCICKWSSVNLLWGCVNFITVDFKLQFTTTSILVNSPGNRQKNKKYCIYIFSNKPRGTEKIADLFFFFIIKVRNFTQSCSETSWCCSTASHPGWGSACIAILITDFEVTEQQFPSHSRALVLPLQVLPNVITIMSQ